VRIRPVVLGLTADLDSYALQHPNRATLMAHSLQGGLLGALAAGTIYELEGTITDGDKTVA